MSKSCGQLGRVAESNVPKTINTLGELKAFLGAVTHRGYHIDFDKVGNTIAMVYPEDLGMARLAFHRMSAPTRRNVFIKEISVGRRVLNWLTRAVFK